MRHPVTPDGRYFVVRGRLGRMAARSVRTCPRRPGEPALVGAPEGREAKRTADRDAEAAAHRSVDEAKRALSERGPVWWNDGSPDLNRHMAKNTRYSDWYAKIGRERGGS